jgi:hypothetical protein
LSLHGRISLDILCFIFDWNYDFRSSPRPKTTRDENDGKDKTNQKKKKTRKRRGESPGESPMPENAKKRKKSRENREKKAKNPEKTEKKRETGEFAGPGRKASLTVRGRAGGRFSERAWRVPPEGRGIGCRNDE